MNNIFTSVMVSFGLFVVLTMFQPTLFSACGTVSSFMLFVLWAYVEFDDLADQRDTQHGE